ncbi:MAG: BrnT family toxin [Ardenticatenales bacterium]|nr:BrnT family toxin [Ardenticatenales bacterium]
MSLLFEWDENKAQTNLNKHGISFDEAQTVFTDNFSIMITDPNHSDDEERLIIIGRANTGTLLVVVYTERDAKIRLISARKATREERRKYEAADSY